MDIDHVAITASGQEEGRSGDFSTDRNSTRIKGTNPGIMSGYQTSSLPPMREDDREKILLATADSLGSLGQVLWAYLSVVNFDYDQIHKGSLSVVQTKVARGTLFTNGDRDVNFQKGATFKIRVKSALSTDTVNAILEGGLAGKD